MTWVSRLPVFFVSQFAYSITIYINLSVLLLLNFYFAPVALVEWILLCAIVTIDSMDPIDNCK